MISTAKAVALRWSTVQTIAWSKTDFSMLFQKQ
jgi:hypothetical protein